MGNKILFGLTPGIIGNEEEVKVVLNKYGVDVFRVLQVIEETKNLLGS